MNGQADITVGSLALYGGGNSKLYNGSTTADASLSGTVQLVAANTEIGGAGNIVINNVVNGGGGFNKTGAGTLTLTGANTYSGVSIFSGGIVNVATLSDYGVAGGLGNRAGDTGGEDMGLLFRGGTLQYTGSTPQSTNRVLRVSTVGGGGTIDASGSVPTATLTFTAATTPNFWENAGDRTLTFTGTNTGANTFATAIPDLPGVTRSAVAKTGPGTWYLTSTSSNYRGITVFGGGILNVASLSNYDALGPSAAARPGWIPAMTSVSFFRGARCSTQAALLKVPTGRCVSARTVVVERLTPPAAWTRPR